MTNLEIITKALQELKLVGSNQSARAEDAQDMLDILNGMMAEWEMLDKNFNWFPQDTLSDVCPIPRWAERGVISNLALSGAPQMAAQITIELISKADLGMKVINNVLMNTKIQPADMSNIHKGRDSSNNILTDS